LFSPVSRSGVGNFYEGSGRKYFRFLGPHTFCWDYSALPRMCESNSGHHMYE
jgi:hypothetical protein